MKPADRLNIGSPLTRKCRCEPSALARLKVKSRNASRAAILARSSFRSASFQPVLVPSVGAPAKSPTRIPSISSTGPETLVKLPFSSCSQYQSDASSVRLR